MSRKIRRSFEKSISSACKIIKYLEINNNFQFNSSIHIKYICISNYVDFETKQLGSSMVVKLLSTNLHSYFKFNYLKLQLTFDFAEEISLPEQATYHPVTKDFLANDYALHISQHATT